MSGGVDASGPRGAATSFAELTVDAFLEQTASRAPTPGGGAVAAIIGAHGAALGQMVVNYSIGSKKYAEYESLHRASLKVLADARAALLTLADRDAAAYSTLSGLWKHDKEDPAQAATFAEAVRAAIDAPGRMIDVCLSVLKTLEQLCGKTNRMLRSDLAIAADVTATAARSAAWNVRINLPLLDDADATDQSAHDVTVRLEAVDDLADSVQAQCRS